MTNLKSPKTYNKSDSIAGLRGVVSDATDILSRIKAFSERLPTLSFTAYKKSILERACANLLSANGETKDGFWLRPHIVEELRRLRDDELGRYLYYRFRYDVFPTTKELDDYPPCVQVEPTSICNYRCVFCYQTDQSFSRKSGGHMGMMPLDTFKRTIDELEGNVEAVTLASRGEPLVCPDIEPMLEYLSGKFLGLKMNTNAWFLDEQKAHAILAAEPNTLVFSADAADDELYAKLRVGGKLQRVLDNIKQFHEIKEKHYPNSRIITRVSGVRFTEEQNMDDLEAFWHDYVDQVAFVDYNPWINSYENDANGITAPCSDLWRRAFVWWDGLVNPCDVDYRSDLAAGNVQEKSLSEIWRGEEYEELRQRHLNNSRQDISPCKGCVVL